MLATVFDAVAETSPTALLAVSVALASGLTIACVVYTFDDPESQDRATQR
jgi:hypothetical protein